MTTYQDRAVDRGNAESVNRGRRTENPLFIPNTDLMSDLFCFPVLNTPDYRLVINKVEFSGSQILCGLAFLIGLALAMMNPFQNADNARTLALAIVNTLPEPFIVLDERLRVLAASRSFYKFFKVDPQQTRGSLLYDLGDGQWDIPALRLLLEKIIPRHAAMDGFEVEHDFPSIGRRVMLLSARQVLYEDSDNATILLAFSDVTSRRAVELEKESLLAKPEALLSQNRVLMQEIQHRVGNSLQMIASILLLRARAVTLEETRAHLQDAYERVMSVAAVQSHLNAFEGVDQIEVRIYLSKLCENLASSMITSNEAVNVGLIVTELLINAIKYAFPTHKLGAAVFISYEIDGAAWRLMISDNGAGRGVLDPARPHGGLGTTIVNALVKQLGARMHIMSSKAGMTIAITSPTFTARLPQAA